MRLIITILFIATMSIAQTQKAPQPIEFVSAKKFSGLWYEIARTYNSFEKDCVAATVEYILVEPLKFDVKNRCFNTTMEGDLIQYNGTAEPSNGKDISKIDLTYFWIFTQEYQIIYLNDDYTTAVMVDNKMENVWVMHRKPFLQKEIINTIVSYLDNYMDTSKLIYTPQDSKGRYK